MNANRLPWRLIALDMDGTSILPDGSVSEENVYWLGQAKESGIVVTFATGRHRKGSLESYLKHLKIEAPVVTLNGGEVWYGDELLARHPLTHEQIHFLYQLGKRHNAYCWGSTTEGPVGESQFPHPLDSATWVKFGYHVQSPVDIERLLTELTNRDDFEVTNSDVLNLEVNPRGVNKAQGLQVVCDVLGIQRDQVIAIGDSRNDIAMIKWAGLGVAMGNAQPEVKSAADVITTRLEEDGVAHIVRKVLMQTKEQDL